MGPGHRRKVDGRSGNWQKLLSGDFANKKGRAEALPFSNIDYLLVFQLISKRLVGTLQLLGRTRNHWRSKSAVNDYGIC